MILAYCNQKGGVGKSTTVYHHARAAILAGLRVLVIDADPQGNITSVLTDDMQEGDVGVADALSSRSSDNLATCSCPVSGKASRSRRPWATTWPTCATNSLSHRSQAANRGELRVVVLANQVHSGHQLRQSVDAPQLRLGDDHDGVGGRECTDRQRVDSGAAVDEHQVIVGLDRGELRAQPRFAAWLR